MKMNLDNLLQQETLFTKKYFHRDITSYMFSFITIGYFLGQYSTFATKLNEKVTVIYIILTLILAIVPLSRPFSSNNPTFYIYLNGAIIIIIMFVQEEMIGKYVTVDFSVYLGMVIIYRSVTYRTSTDNCALCTAYIADVFPTQDKSLKYKVVTIMTYMCGIGVFSLSVMNILFRIKKRIREHILVLLILLERHQKDVEQTKSMLKMSIPSEFFQDFDENANIKPDEDIDDIDNKIKNEAMRRKLIPQYQEAQLNVNNLASTMSIKKKFTVIIGFRHVDEDSDCYVSSLRLNKIHRLFDLIAKMHKISCVHRFGGKWLGCIGFFEDSWGAASNDCYHAIIAAFEILQLAARSQSKICVAIDCGYVIGGFVGQNSFDLFGAEVRWTLNTVDFNRVGEILISHNVKSKLRQDVLTDVPIDLNLKFTKTSLVGRDNDDKVYVVNTEVNLLNVDSLQKVKDEIDNMNDYFHSFGENEHVDLAKNNPNDTNGSNMYMYYIYSILQYWESNISPEFKSDTFKRFGITMDNQTLKECSSGLLEIKMNQIHSELDDLVVNSFSSTWRYLLLIVPFLQHESNKVRYKAQSELRGDDQYALDPLKLISETRFGRFLEQFLSFRLNRSPKYSPASDSEELELLNIADNNDESDSTEKNSVNEDNDRSNIISMSQYNSDSTLISHLGIFCIVGTYSLLAFSLITTFSNLDIEKNHDISAIFLGIHIIAIVLQLISERTYDYYIYVGVSCCSILLMILLPYCFIDHIEESVILSLFFFLYVIEFRSEIKLILIHHGILILVLIINASISTNSMIRISTVTNLVFLFLIRLACMWIIQYHTYMSFVLEHKLMPEALKIVDQQKEQKLKTYQAWYPHMSDFFFLEGTRARRHLKVAVMAIHIKASEILPAILHQQQLGIFLRNVLNAINTCINESGLIKLSQFCGLVIAASCDDFQKSNQQVQAPVSYVTKCFVFIRNLQKRLDDLDQNYNFNIAVGLGLSHGPITTGTFCGNYGNTFVLSEDVRIQVHQMAFCRRKGFYASMAFESEISKGKLFDDTNVRRVKMSVKERSEDWLSIGGADSGMEIDDFEPITVIGKGGYGTVVLCVHKENGVQYAVKVISRKVTTTEDHNVIQRELVILQKIKHANVVNFKFCLIKEPKIYLVMTLVNGGNLKQVLDKDPSIGVEQLRIWFAELVLAIEYIHGMRIIHRDVKPSNCMIDEEGHLKLADFGLSKLISEPLEKQELNNDSNDLNDETVKLLQKILFLKPYSNERQIINEVKFQIVLIDLTHNTKLAIDLMESLFDVFIVSSLNEAIELKNKKRKQEFDIILVNLHLYKEPDEKYLNSVAIIKEIRERELYSHLPVIALTQTDESWIQQICMTIRATECLLLPWQISYRDLVVKHCRYVRLINGSSLSSVRSKSNKMYPSNLNTLNNSDPFLDVTKEFKSESILSATPASTVQDGTAASTLNPMPQQKLKSQDRQQHSAVGTINFMAPEVITDRRYGKAVDWWAVGVTFYECATRNRLFNGNDKNLIFEQIKSLPIDLSPLEVISPSLSYVVSKLLERDPSTRLGTEGTAAIKSAEFFKDIDWNSISESEMPYKPEPLTIDENERNRKLARQIYYGADQPFFKQFNQLNSSCSSRDRRRDHYKRKKRSIGSHVKLWVSGEYNVERKETSGFFNSKSFNNSLNYTIEEMESEGSSSKSTLLHSGEIE